MADETTTTAEETATQETATEETTQTEPIVEEPEVNYDEEFTQAVEKFETAEKNREGYSKRKETTTQTQTEVEPMTQERIDEMVGNAVKKAIPQLQSTLVEDQVETVLDQLSNGNEAKKKLIRFHFENSVAPNGTIRERMENALLIADKKTIFKTQKEMAVALYNRQGLSNSGQGTSTEGMEVADNYFTKDQLAELKAKGFDDAKIQRLKANMQRSR